MSEFANAIRLPIPRDVDISDLAYLQLHILRLQKSRTWLRARANPALGFYSINLWMAAQQSIPSGSLEDDDDILADAAQCHPRDWPKTKEDALRNWVLIGGRYYHPFLCEIIWSVWLERLKARHISTLSSWRSACARADRAAPPEPHPAHPGAFEDWMRARFPASAQYMEAAARVETESTRVETESTRVEAESTRVEAESTRVETESTRVKPKNSRAKTPKRSEAKGKDSHPPVVPPAAGDNPPPMAAGRGGGGLGKGVKSSQKDWFKAEKARLEQAFGHDPARLLMSAMSHTQPDPGVAFVRAFKGARVTHDGAGTVIAIPKKAQADQARVQWGALMREILGARAEIVYEAGA